MVFQLLVLVVFFAGWLAGSESEEAVRLLLEAFPSLGGARVVMIGAMIGGRGAGEDSSVGELRKFSTVDLICVRVPGAGVVGCVMDKLSLPRTPQEVVHKVCSGVGEQGGEEWIVPLPDVTGVFCFVSKLM